MGYYEMDYSWVWQIAGFLAVAILATAGVNWILRKILKVERKKWFSHSSNFVNDFHEKVNDYFRWGSVAVYLLILLSFGFERGGLYFIAVSLVIGGFQELFNAYMEKRHSGNPNDYKFTLLGYPIDIIILLTCAAAFFPEITAAILDEFFY